MNENLKKEIIQDIKNINEISIEEILKMRKARLEKLIKYAKENSEYIKELYKNIDVDNFDLKDLPIMEKSTMMENFDDWVCDKDIKRENVEKYLSDFDALSEPFLGKYKAMMTSGTTGNPLIMLRDAFHLLVHGHLINERFFKNVPSEFMDFRISKTVGIIITGQPTSSYTSYQKTISDNPKYKDNFMLISTLDSVEKIIEKLNKFQPVTIFGYPSVISLLANEQLNGKLTISPKVVGCSAELLTETMYNTMKEAWGNDLIILNNYCSTEGGEIAMSCDFNKLHVNMDWVIMEPVDENDNLVIDEETSAAVLVTDLSNFVQPIIRFKLNDRIKILKEKCACGSILPVIEVGGRVSDTIKINSKTIPSVAFMVIMEHLPTVLSYQFAQIAETKIVLRVIYSKYTDKLDFNKQITAKFEELKKTYNCPELEFEIKEEQPKNSQRGGKLKLVVKEI